MAVKQAGVPVTHDQLSNAHRHGSMTGFNEQWACCTPDIAVAEGIKCRFYPKLSFFFDGTGNNLQQELAKTVEDRALSNVAKLYQAAIDDKDRQEAVPVYIPGVGTPYRYPYSNVSPNEDRGGAIGPGFGAGGDMRLNVALHEFRRILEGEWSAGALRHMQWITLSVFGFSRGATDQPDRQNICCYLPSSLFVGSPYAALPN